MTLAGVVRNGKIQLGPRATLPEGTRVTIMPQPEAGADAEPHSLHGFLDAETFYFLALLNPRDAGVSKGGKR